MANRKIKLLRIAHIYYIHTNLEKANEFLLDFGFVETERRPDRVFYKGYGTEPFVYCAIKGQENNFGGAAFVVDSLSDLELASKTLPSATAVKELDGPGGGKIVTFKDPVDGFPFHLVYGQSWVEADTDKDLPQLVFNFPREKHREVNRTQRFKKAPAPIHKIGHFGCCVTDFEKSYEFYTSRFNFKASDLLHDDKGRDVMVFMHLDLGLEEVDHHCFFFYQGKSLIMLTIVCKPNKKYYFLILGPSYHIHHSSYEVHDFDIQSLGHQWLRDKGHELVWGVGRHILGSQIFDYWRDPSNFIMEHYGKHL